MPALYQQHCVNTSYPALTDKDELHALLLKTENWQLSSDNKHIEKTFSFNDYQQTSQFVNAVIDIAQQQDHHPDISFSYKQCSIRYSTHSAGGLTMNDFICAARIDHLDI